MKISNGVNAFSNGSPTVGIGWDWSVGQWTFAGDFNGDGCSDIASVTGGTAYMKWGGPSVTTSGFGHTTTTINGSWGNNPQYTKVGDFNGDGRDDIASASAGNMYMKFGNANGTWSSATWTVVNQWSTGEWTFATDFNGDTLADFASVTAGTAYMKLSTGSGFTSAIWSIANVWGQAAYAYAGDFTGDGRADIASFAGSNVYIKQSTGSGFSYGGPQAANTQWGHPGYARVGDFDGDNDADVASPWVNTTPVPFLNSAVFMKRIHD